MKLTEREKRVVFAVFDDLLRLPYSELNRYVGSLTIEEMKEIYNKIRFEGYCEKHNIAYEDMTEDDREEAMLEEARKQGYAV